MVVDPRALADEVGRAVEISSQITRDSQLFVPDSRRAWERLAVAVVIGSLGSVGMWSVVVALPEVQGAFGATRGTASLAFTFVMLGFGSGAVLTGKNLRPLRHRHRHRELGNRHSRARLYRGGNVVDDLAVHPGAFRHRAELLGDLRPADGGGLALVRALSGTCRPPLPRAAIIVGGTIWPPVVNWGRADHRLAPYPYRASAFLTAIAMTITLAVLRRLMGRAERRSHVNAPPPRVDLRLNINVLTAILSLASIACCVAMAMPQVHIVAYCGDLGYGVARGAEMLSLMLGFGIISRIGFRLYRRPGSAASALFCSDRWRRALRCCFTCSSTA